MMLKVGIRLNSYIYCATSYVAPYLSLNIRNVPGEPASVQISDNSLTRTGGGFLSPTNFAFSGDVVNSGGSASNQVVILNTVKDSSGNIIFTTTASPTPDILQPGQRAPFFKSFNTNDLGGYSGQFSAQGSIEQQ
jgi:hypothetical protein